MTRNKRQEISLINQNLPNTKTVWGLTKEEIEFCAYLFQVLAFLVLVIGFVYVAITLKQWFGSTEGGSRFTIALILFLLSFIPMGFGFYGVNYENRIALIVFCILAIFSLFVYLFATILLDFLLIGTVLIEIIFFLQLILAVMLILCLMAHNEIFKKEVTNWMEKPMDQISLTISDEPAEIYGSTLDGSNKTKIKEDKQTNQNKFKENAKDIQTKDSKSEDLTKNSLNKMGPNNRTEGPVLSNENTDSSSEQNTKL